MSQRTVSAGSSNRPRYGQVANNEPLLGGFALLRAAQLLNCDVYYIGSLQFIDYKTSPDGVDEYSSTNELVSPISEGVIGQSSSEPDLESANYYANNNNKINTNVSRAKAYNHTILDELASYNPLQKHIDRSRFLRSLCNFLKIGLSLLALTLGLGKLILATILILASNIDTFGNYGSSAAKIRIGLLLLFLLNISSLHIMFSIIFNGHLLWQLLEQRLFLVTKRCQYKTMLYLLPFIYAIYIVKISFVNNLYDWDSTSNDIESSSYSVLANLRIIATDHDSDNYWLDLILNIMQFVRLILTMSPYITLNYVLICLKRHIYTVRNQNLLTESLKRRQKLRLAGAKSDQGKKRRVIFSNGVKTEDLHQKTGGGGQLSTISGSLGTNSNKEEGGSVKKRRRRSDEFLDKVRDFDELESYITNLYIFTGRLNRIMSQQGVTVFFILTNLLITVSIILPETIHGGPPMVYLIRGLLIMTALAPFVFGQSLEDQLDQLSKQIDRIIILQQFSHHRRDNLVRIRELVHDISVNCGGMLKFNVETGIKFLVVAFASAFFIEQEHYKLTRRH